MNKRSDGRWQQAVTIEVNGTKKVKYFYGKSKAEVLRKMAEYEEAEEKGRTVQEIADEWWAKHEPTLSPSAVEGYRRGYRRVVADMGSKRIRELRPVDIQRHIERMVSAHDMSQKSASNHLIIVKGICKYAVSTGDVDYDISRDITPPRKLRKTPRKMPESADLAAIKAGTGAGHFLACLALYAGMRKSEILALTWEDIDREDGTITVNKAAVHKGNKAYLKETKTAAGERHITIINRLAEAMPESGTGLVFPDPNGGLMTEKHYIKLWGDYLEQTGARCTLHQLRHAYATMLLENDIDAKDAQQLLGHAQVGTTQDIYTEVRRQREKIVGARLMDADIE